MLREHPKKRSLDTVVELFIADCRSRQLSARTIEHYEWSVRAFRASLGTDPASQVLADVTADAARRWAAGLAGTRTPTSVRSAMRGLKVLAAWAVREGMLADDPLAPVRLPRAPSPLILPLSGAQVAAIMEVGPPVLTVAVALCADTGLRASELCGLQVGDVRDGFLRVRLAKGRRERLVPYGAQAAVELTRYVNHERPVPVGRADEPLLLQPNGAPLTAHRFGELMRTAGKRAGIRGVRRSPHTLRHTFALEFLRNGGGELALQKALGHRSLDMVRVYADLTEIDLLEAHGGASPLDRWRREGTVGRHRRGGRPRSASSSSSRSSGESRSWWA